MSPVHDLHLPRLPDHVDAPGSPPDTLLHAGPAGRRPFLAASPHIVVHGTELEGVDRVVAGAGEILRTLRTGAGPCSNVLLGPRSTRRELTGPGGTVLETLLVADRHPGLVVHWATPSGEPLALDVRWDVPGGAVAQRSAGPVLRVRPERGPDTVFAVLPAPGRWQIDPTAEELGVRVRVRADRGPVTLMAAAVDPGETGEGVLRALGRTAVLEARTESFLSQVRTDFLATRTGVAGIDDGLAWAVARTTGGSPLPPARSGRPEPPPDTPHDPLARFWMLAGLLAAGDMEAARSRIDAEPTDAAGTLALGWWVRWTGDTAPFHRHRSAALGTLDSKERGGTRPTRLPPAASPDGGVVLPQVVRRAARAAAADALEALGEKDGAASLRAAGPDAAPSPAPGRTAEPTEAPGPRPGDRTPGRRLPMVGDPDGAPRGHAPRDDTVLAALLGYGSPDSSPTPPGPGELPLPPPDTPPPTGVRRALLAWALYALDRPDEGYLLLREHLEEGVTPPAGLWTAGGDPDPLAAALAPAIVLHGLLGARAEAPWDRLRLAPALPSGWSRFEVRGIRMGEARVSLRYARREGTHTFFLEQTAGRMPLNLVFEPSVPGGVDEVRVDGASTDVTPERRHGRTRVRLQLPLDTERKVTLAGSQA